MRISAIRPASAPISPVVRSIRETCRSIQAGEIRPLLPGQVHENPADQAVVRLAQDLAEIGNLAAFPQQGDGRRVIEPGAQAGLAGQRREGAEVFRFARRREVRRRRRQRQGLWISASTVSNDNSGLRQKTKGRGSKLWDSIASIRSASNSPAFAVVPKVPSCMCRPARPAICPISAGVQAPAHAPVELDQIGKGDVGSHPC